MEFVAAYGDLAGLELDVGDFGSPILMLLICMCRSEGIQKYKAIRCRALFFLRPNPDGHYRDCIKSMDSVSKIRNFFHFKARHRRGK